MTPEIKQRIEQIRRGEVPEGYVKKRKVVIPQQWGLPQIKDIASISSGSTPNRNNSEYWNGNIAWVTTGELSSGHVNHTSELITVKAVKETKMRIYVEEQKAIADTFIAADREIELLQQDIEQEKQKKKALMQLLLTGIVRVKT